MKIYELDAPSSIERIDMESYAKYTEFMNRAGTRVYLHSRLSNGFYLVRPVGSHDASPLGYTVNQSGVYVFMLLNKTMPDHQKTLVTAISC